MQSELLTPEEAAVYLRLNPQTTYRLLRGGQLPGVKIGRQWRIRKTALEAFLDGRAPAAAPAAEPRSR
jgi:excisionase family DNA binding protein